MGTSKAEGFLVVPSWSDDGEVKPAINDDGRFPVTLEEIGAAVSIQVSNFPASQDVVVTNTLLKHDVDVQNFPTSFDVDVQNYPSEYVVRGHSYINSSWYKNAFVFGISDVYHDSQVETNVGAGNKSVSLSTVPSGEIWVITHAYSFCSSNSPTVMFIQVKDAGNTYTVFRDATTNPSDGMRLKSPIYLMSGEYLVFAYNGCIASDDLYAYAHGYKMDVGL